MGKEEKPKKTSSAKGQRDWQRYKESGKYDANKKRITNAEIPGKASAYPPVNKKQVYKLYLLGLNDERVADILDVSLRQLQNWKKEYPEFLHTIKKAKELTDGEIVNAMRRRALGYKHKATKIFYNAQEDKIVTKEYVERYPPDVAAASFLLRNRQPHLFKDKPEVELDITSTPPVVNVTVHAQEDKLDKLNKDAQENE